MGRVYIAIDLKSFYASVECVERGLDPLTARLVVADFSRTEKTICLAVSPALKAYGISGRARLYEVIRAARANKIDFEAAPPRMRKYMEVSQKIYAIYATFVSPHDIHVYSIDEVFIDATDYVKLYGVTAHELAERMIHKVLAETGITATAGIGTNLYLAKVAMDIKAKHMPADEHGVRIAELDEMSYRRELWEHMPLTDFWRVGPGYSRRLAKLGIHNMGELARYSLKASEKLYQVFGVNAELLIDHAWGYEPVTMKDIKEYSSENHSVSSGQVLSRPYDTDEARLIVWEMSDALALDMFSKKIVADKIVLTVCYEASKEYRGNFQTDYYGRVVPKSAHGTISLDKFTNSSTTFTEKSLELYDRIIDPSLMVRRIYVVAEHAKVDDGVDKPRQLDIFTDYEKMHRDEDKEKRLQQATIEIRRKYGKNSLLRAANFEEAATMRQRNNQVGGHRA